MNRRTPGNPAELSDGPDDVAKVHIYPTHIPAFTYGIDPPTPPAEIPTFGPRLLLVAHEAVPAAAVRRVLETVFSPSFAELAKPPLDLKLLETPPEYDRHLGTEQFVDYNKPVLAGDIIDLLEKGCSLAGAILGSLLFLVALNIAAEAIFAPPKPAKPGYVIEIPKAGGSETAKAAPEESFDKLLASEATAS